MEKMILNSKYSLEGVTKNIGTMLLNNREQYPFGRAFAERRNDEYHFRDWIELTDDIINFAAQLIDKNLVSGDRVALVSENSYHRLVAEMAIMSLGIIAVPIFPGYPEDLKKELIDFAEVKMILRNEILDLGKKLSQKTVKDIMNKFKNVDPSTTAIIMYTSGTSSFPKGAQLSHFNLMSQQGSLKLLWKPEPGMRFLCYLPWHHSFGGLFERFFILHSAGCLAIDDSLGKDVERMLENCMEIKPHIFFSVPKIYQEIVSRVLTSKDIENTFFHNELKFVFTAAAPLSLSTSKVFKSKGIPVVEGWGLTETSPCCTLTDFTLEREQGIVGFPIHDVKIKLGEDNEILVKGPNVMSGYFKDPKKSSDVLDSEKWFSTGDVGEITEHGLKIISRKDRVFKLSNGEKVIPNEIEERSKGRCRFIKYAYVTGQGQGAPILLVFPDLECFKLGDNENSQNDFNCAKPGNAKDFSNCLGKCLFEINKTASAGYGRIGKALIVDAELAIEKGELTPSFKIVPRKIEEEYGATIRAMEENRNSDLPENVFIVPITGIRGKLLQYGLIGLGPVGTAISGMLSAAGNKVTVLEQDEEKCNYLKKNEVVISGAMNARGKISYVYNDLAKFMAADHDVIFICTKTSSSLGLLKAIKELNLGKVSLFVSCQNGLDVEKQIVEVFGAEHALRMVLNFGAGIEQHNQVHLFFQFSHFLSKTNQVDLKTIEQIADDISAAGMKTEIREDYMTEVFKKVILNMTMGSICALTGMSMKEAFDQDDLARMMKQMVSEGIAVGQAMNLSISDSFLDEAMKYLSHGGDHKPSILVDIEKGRKTENEYLCGKVYAYAKKHGVQVPVTQTVYYLLKYLEENSVKNHKETYSEEKKI